MHGFFNSSRQLQYYNKLIMLFIIRYGAIKEPELILLFGKYATNTCFFRWKWCRISHLFKSFHIPTYLATQNQTILKTLKRKRILKTQFIKDSLLSDKKCCFFLVSRPLPPPPLLSGRATKKKSLFADSLTKIYEFLLNQFLDQNTLTELRIVKFNFL